MTGVPGFQNFKELHHAAIVGDTHVIADFIRRFGTARIDATIESIKGQLATPLLRAVNAWKTDAAELLIKAGASPYATDENGYNPYQQAIWVGLDETVACMLENGADANYAGFRHGCTPIHIAADAQHTRMITLLLKHGARINEPDRSGNTPLMNAVKQGHTAIVDFLLLKGAGLAAVNVNGQTVFDIAEQGGHPPTTAVLKAARRARVEKATKSTALKNDIEVFKNPLRLRRKLPSP